MITFLYEHQFLCQELWQSHSIYVWCTNLYWTIDNQWGLYFWELWNYTQNVQEMIMFYQVDDYIIITVNLYVE